MGFIVHECDNQLENEGEGLVMFNWLLEWQVLLYACMLGTMFC